MSHTQKERKVRKRQNLNRDNTKYVVLLIFKGTKLARGKHCAWLSTTILCLCSTQSKKYMKGNRLGLTKCLIWNKYFLNLSQSCQTHGYFLVFLYWAICYLIHISIRGWKRQSRNHISKRNFVKMLLDSALPDHINIQLNKKLNKRPNDAG